MLTVASIDPALANIGIAITCDYIPLHFEKVNLWQAGDKSVSKWNSNLIIKRIQHNFGPNSRIYKLIHAEVSVLCVEVQMRQKMRFVEGLIIGALNHPNTVCLHPAQYKKAMRLATGDYALNKSKAVSWCGSALDSWNGKGKKDDIADAYCMCCYYTARQKNQTIPYPISLYVSQQSNNVYQHYKNGKRQSQTPSPPPPPSSSWFLAQVQSWNQTRSTQNWSRSQRSRKNSRQRLQTRRQNYRTWIQQGNPFC